MLSPFAVLPTECFQRFLNRHNIGFWLKSIYQVKKYMSILILLRKISRNNRWVSSKCLFSISTIRCLLSLDRFTNLKNITSQNKSHSIVRYSFNALPNSANILFRMFALIFLSETGLLFFYFCAVFVEFWRHFYDCIIKRIWKFSFLFFLSCTS